MEQAGGVTTPTVLRGIRDEKKGLAYRPKTLWKTLNKYKFYYLLALPGLLYFVIFKYLPMVGIIIAFQDYQPFEGFRGMFDGPWVGLKHFKNFINSYYFRNIMGNTLIISGLKLLWGFPAPIILALMINEVRNIVFKKTAQTISYLPHFFSMVIVAGMVRALLTVQGGLVNYVIKFFGGTPYPFLTDPKYFRSILVATSVWQGIGWGSILYLAAITNIDPALYEAAMIDGASRLQQMRYITLPSIAYVIAIVLIFRIGGLLNAGFQQVLLLYSPQVYKVADIIDTYVYRSGLLSMQYSYAAAVGVFKSILALILLLIANKVAKWVGQPGIW